MSAQSPAPNLSRAELSSSSSTPQSAPSLQEDSQPPLPNLDSTDSTEDIELFYTQQELKMPGLVAMSVGLPDGVGGIFGSEDDFSTDTRFPVKKQE